MTDSDDRRLTWVVGKDGERLDQHVAAKVADLSRSRAQRLIQAGSVLLNGQPAKPSQLLRTGDAIAFTMPPHSDGGVLPEPMALVIVYESADVVVVDKPAGVVVHPAAGQSGGTLVNGMLDRYPEMAEVGPPGRQGVAHRLDRGTSGLVLFGRTPRGLRVLQEQFRAHEIWKTYLALVVGLLRPDKATIDAPIGRHPRERSRMAVVRGGGRPARTQYETIAECPRLLTGAGASAHWAHASDPRSLRRRRPPRRRRPSVRARPGGLGPATAIPPRSGVALPRPRRRRPGLARIAASRRP